MKFGGFRPELPTFVTNRGDLLLDEVGIGPVDLDAVLLRIGPEQAPGIVNLVELVAEALEPGAPFIAVLDGFQDDVQVGLDASGIEPALLASATGLGQHEFRHLFPHWFEAFQGDLEFPGEFVQCIPVGGLADIPLAIGFRFRRAAQTNLPLRSWLPGRSVRRADNHCQHDPDCSRNETAVNRLLPSGER